MSDLSEHYMGTDMTGIRLADQVKSASFFLPQEEHKRGRTEYLDRPLSAISLCHFIDNCGERFMSQPVLPREKIAKAMFEAMSSTEQLMIFSYLESIDDGDE